MNHADADLPDTGYLLKVSITGRAFANRVPSSRSLYNERQNNDL